MAKKYQKPTPTGREYADTARDFNEFTTHMLLKLPKKWKDYILDPIHRAADNIETLALRANRVYVNPKAQNKGELIKSYNERMDLLKEALREFDVFDRKLIHMTDHMNLMQDEATRLKKVLKDMIIKELKAILKEEKTSVEYQINVHQKLNEIEYTTTIGKKVLKLGMSKKNKDHWIDLEWKAKNEISKRLEADKRQLTRLLSEDKKSIVNDMPV